MTLLNLAKDTVTYGGADMLGKLIAFITFPLIASALSPHDFGVIDLVMTTVGLAGVIIGCGLNNAVQRFYWENAKVQGAGPMIISSGLFVQVALGAIFIIASGFLGWAIQDYLSEARASLSWLALLAAVIIAPVAQWIQYIQDITRLKFAKWKFLFLSVFYKIAAAITSVLAVVIFHGGVDWYLISLTFLAICTVPLGLWFIRDDLTLNISKQWSLSLLKFGYPFIFVQIAYWLLGAMDRWMLASISSVSEVGIYGIAYRFSTIVLFLSSAFGMAWSPYSMKVREDNPEKYPELCGNVLTILLYFMMIFGGCVALFSGEIITLVMPDSYEAAGMPLAILCFAIILQSTIQVTAVGISLAKKTHIFAYLAWVVTIINFAGNLLLIPMMGALGAAIATFIANLFLTCGYLYYTQKLYPIKIFWLPLLWLLLLGGIIFTLAIILNVAHIQMGVFLVKMTMAMLCLALGTLALPFNALKILEMVGLGSKDE